MYSEVLFLKLLVDSSDDNLDLPEASGEKTSLGQLKVLLVDPTNQSHSPVYFLYTLSKYNM